MSSNYSRRSFLSHSLVAIPLIACRGSIREAVAACPTSVPTDTNIEGPYYRTGAPLRSDLTDPGVIGTPLLITGSVLSLDCRSPLSDAVLDVWQADGDGHYDNDGSSTKTGMRLRGLVKVDAKGAFSFRSVMPGRYLNGRTYRPAHVHVKVTAKGHTPLTTQLYFPNDPFNAIDPFIKKSLVMDVSKDTAHFDFVLAPT